MRLAARKNRLLAALPDLDLRRLLRELRLVELKKGIALHGPGAAPGQAFFPTTAIVSLRYGLTSPGAPESAIVGNDGVVGSPVFLGGRGMPGSAVIEVGGWGLRIRAEALRGEFSSAPAVLEVLLGHTRALIAQMAQTSICNHLHTVEQRFIRRLLLCLDLSDQQELPMTHETMARSLGMRRSSVTESALCLQGLGLIRYARGRIAVVDRLGLERRGCACYVHISESVEQVSPASQLATMATS